MIFTDSHAHLPQVAERLGDAALAAILDGYENACAAEPELAARPLLIDIGTEAGDFPSRLALLGRRAFLRYSLGVWPGEEALADPAASVAVLAAALDAAGPDARALGECGLDYFHMEGSREAQLELFRGQRDLALSRGIPLIVHSRDAFEDTAAELSGLCAAIPVVIHCFGYGQPEVDAFLKMGCHISFTGNITYKKSQGLRDALLRVPGERLLLETDAPYMNPEPMRGKPSSPSDIARTYAFAAALRGEDVETLAHRVTANARFLFGVDPGVLAEALHRGQDGDRSF